MQLPKGSRIFSKKNQNLIWKGNQSYRIHAQHWQQCEKLETKTYTFKEFF